MRWLAAVWAPGLDPIVGPNRDIEFRVKVTIVVPDQKSVAPIGISEPAFESARNAGSESELRLVGQLLSGQQDASSQDQRSP